MNLIKKYFSKRKAVMIGIVVVFFAVILILVDNNYNYYSESIVSVTDVKEDFCGYKEGPNEEQESYYLQKIKALIRNGTYEGKEIQLENEYSYSGVKTEKYEYGDDLFVEISESHGELSGSIVGVKRDKYVVFLVGLFAIGMVLITGKQGILTLISLTINIIIFVLCVNQYAQGKDFGKVCLTMLILFSSLTLLILGGVSRKTFGAILSTLLTVAMTFGLYHLVITYIEQPPYELMDYIAGPEDLNKIFMAGIIIGCLGAVMDVSITINSAVHELVLTAENLTWKKLIKSIREIGHDIMGTMINVLLFTYISGSLPIIILKIKNGYSVFALVKFNIVFEITRFFVGSIGIILAIPISGFVAVLFLKKGMIKGNVDGIRNLIFSSGDSDRRRKRG